MPYFLFICLKPGPGAGFLAGVFCFRFPSTQLPCSSITSQIFCVFTGGCFTRFIYRWFSAEVSFYQWLWTFSAYVSYTHCVIISLLTLEFNPWFSPSGKPQAKTHGRPRRCLCRWTLYKNIRWEGQWIPSSAMIDSGAGIPWLRSQNPNINWETKEISFLPKCSPTISPTVAAPVTQNLEEATQVPTLPLVYQEFSDVCDKRKADQLPPHRPYDCPIELLPGERFLSAMFTRWRLRS
ncbi:uncharacterized protein [Phyllobates terribilis]|uniref:uncharacterized protein isoform X3 n=1 Tax=Phyllobates terribilis TaxID=111132 RepID=UPI003CCB1AAC